MNQKRLIERIVGVVVVFAIGFILYSALLDSSGHRRVDRSTQIPPQTRYFESIEFPAEVLESATQEQDVPAQLAISKEQDTPADFVPAESVSVQEAKTAPILDEQGQPNTWVLQVGSFATEKRAIEIRDQLLVQGYRAYYRRVDEPGEQPENSGQTTATKFYRVLVGPYLQADQAVRHQREIDQILELTTMLFKFKP